MVKEFEITDQDVYEAMKNIEGYLDISMSDFRELYQYALRQARKRLLGATPIGEIMTAEVISISPQTTLEGIIEALASRAVSGMPVVDEANRVLGVVSEKDIFMRIGGAAGMSFWRILSNCLHCNRCLLKSIQTVTAADIMTAPAVTVKITEPVQVALQLFSTGKLNRLPVVDEHGRLAGIVTRTDVLQMHLPFEEK